tara:strand:- start:30505 stop:31089 length:585 start_codon:yes stop_codon:yes gene_type:complete
MPRYEYKVVPAPSKGVKGKGIRGPEARFSNAIEQLMNQLSAAGWEYQRAETLPSIERSGLTSTTTEWRNVLVFRKPVDADVTDFAPELLPAPTEQMSDAPETPEKPEAVAIVDTPADGTTTAPQTSAGDGNAPKGNTEDVHATGNKTGKGGDTDNADTGKDDGDNGVEDTNDVSDVASPLETLSKSRKNASSSS